MGDNVCSVAGCSKRIEARGLCDKHYRRWQRHGDPLKGRVAPGTPTAARLAPLIDRSAGPDACWPWTGRRDGAGYGRLSVDGRERRVHQLVYEIEHGPRPNMPGYHGAVVRHSCDNPACCNPAHLILGTVADNNRDRHTRGRTVLPTYEQRMRNVARGARVHGTKLTPSSVREVRRLAAAGLKHGAIALRFGVSCSAVQRIASRRNWRWVA